MIELIQFKGDDYLKLQSEGFAAKFSMPFAESLIGKGKVGYDIGCKFAHWSYPGSILIDPEISPELDAMKLPALQVDYIHSSHCLEHLADWVGALTHWHEKLRSGGLLFLYLPNMDEQDYWRPWHNRKHLHYLNPDILNKYFGDNLHMWDKVKVTGTDLNDSFYCIAEKI